jgi:uncharacterized protein YndB with AHSA1/START domain
MESIKDKIISVETTVKAPIEKTWSYWTEPEHITRWCFATDDWHVPHAENDLHVKGKFLTRMAAKDGSISFDFEGVYTRIEKYKAIEYTIADGRTVKVSFSDLGTKTRVVESFVPEQLNPHDKQKGGWQAILDNFRKYSESNPKK